MHTVDELVVAFYDSGVRLLVLENMYPRQYCLREIDLPHGYTECKTTTEYISGTREDSLRQFQIRLGDMYEQSGTPTKTYLASGWSE